MFFFSRKSQIIIPDYLYDQMMDHARDEYPNECYGVLVGNPMNKIVFEVNRIYNLENDRTVDRYSFNPQELKLIQHTAKIQSLDILGFYHSHPDRGDKPSEYDREAAYPGYSYIIISINKEKKISAKSWSFSSGKEPFKEDEITVRKQKT